jgi:hypothetical protein
MLGKCSAPELHAQFYNAFLPIQSHKTLILQLVERQTSYILCDYIGGVCVCV